ncbi:sugar phosphate isomerase [Methanobrevibacter arboriphilus]|jgi:sugar phosphate isomerase/epimerase|uniref:Sugar phosphate isomerase n=1 Tax=Methanobrevibacter arboriphilus TaxID=39441 RepID=A0ACA8R3R2_METAZ|nr:sugar phosphate isomerase/epimerase family protein [Methanobrevibacter arboriphilus]BBL62261.1 sugar phosphate isomerase [Methanobrevibacter arboriphilus]GLI11720.1 sugar phosphate isomerase [Methanobrevibacter arboriphilus]
MKIGVSSSSIYEKNLQKSLEYAEKLDIKYVEIMNEYPNDSVDVDMMNSYDIKYSIHSPITDLNIASLNKSIQKASINEIKKSIDLANKLDSDIVVIHPSGMTILGYPCEDKILSTCKESLEICGKYGEDNGVMATVENMPNSDWLIHQNIFKLNELLLEINMYMTLDIGHASTMEYKERDLYFDSIKHLHLSDNFLDKDLHLGLGKGKIDFKNIIKVFKKNNYKGKYILEINDKSPIVDSINYLKRL